MDLVPFLSHQFIGERGYGLNGKPAEQFVVDRSNSRNSKARLLVKGQEDVEEVDDLENEEGVEIIATAPTLTPHAYSHNVNKSVEGILAPSNSPTNSLKRARSVTPTSSPSKRIYTIRVRQRESEEQDVENYIADLENKLLTQKDLILQIANLKNEKESLEKVKVELTEKFATAEEECKKTSLELEKLKKIEEKYEKARVLFQ